MPITLQTNRIKFKNTNNEYVAVDVITDSPTDAENMIASTFDPTVNYTKG